MPSELQRSANSYIRSTRAQWRELVILTRNTLPKDIDQRAKRLAKYSGVGVRGLKSKIEAISFAMGQGLTNDQIVAQGQEKTIGIHAKSKVEKRLDPLVNMTWRVPPDLAYHVKKRVYDLAKVMGLRTSTEFWSWFHGESGTWTKEMCLHSIGEPELPRRHDEKAET